MNGYFDIKSYGAIGDGVADDTVAIQNAIVAAQVLGEIVWIPGGKYRTTAPLAITDRVTILGVGCPGDGGNGYKGFNFYPIPAVLKGSVILPGAHDAFHIDTNQAVQLEKFQISYAQGAASGSNTIGIRGNSMAGASNANMGSTFRDLWVTNADHSMTLNNFLNFHIDHVFLMYHWIDGLTLDNPNYPNYGDSTIINSLFWGGASSNSGHLTIHSTGGIKIALNKFTAGSTSSNAILFQPNASGVQHIEPSIIGLNSIEGPTNGITMVSSNSQADMTQTVIVGNQIWAGLYAIYSQPGPGGAEWIAGNVVSGNVLCNTGTSGYVAIMDGWRDTAFGENLFANSAGSPGTGLYLGPHTANVGVQSDKFVSGMTPVLNSGTGNTIGGGSS